MNTTRTRAGRTATLEVPGARLYYEVRGSGPPVVLIGAPMDAIAFAPLADLLAVDHTVLTTDPRGIHRSQVDDSEADSTPVQRADDLSRLIAHIDAGPAAVFGSSGGAVTALALTQAHPDQVHTVVAHEAPLNDLLEDRDQLHDRTEDCCATYLAGDTVAAWSKFFDTANIPVPVEAVEQIFGRGRDPQTIADEWFWFAHEMRPSTRWRPDLAQLRSIPSRIVVGIGEDSTGQLCDRTSRALANALDAEPTIFPGGHTGFLDSPATFAPRLRAVLRNA